MPFHLPKITRRGVALVGRLMLQAAVCVAPLAMVVSLALPTCNVISNQYQQMKAARNCREIIGLLHAFAAENGSRYPDSFASPVTGAFPVTSNEAFRVLFREGITMDEKIFGCPSSRYVPDTHIGAAPLFDQALLPGENHWAMTQGQSTISVDIMPLVFENPVAAGWPPQWNADADGRPVPGRAWAGGKIVVGRNDGSVETIKLQAVRGESIGPRPLSNGVETFTQARQNAPLHILNIAVGPLPKAP